MTRVGLVSRGSAAGFAGHRPGSRVGLAPPGRSAVFIPNGPG